MSNKALDENEKAILSKLGTDPGDGTVTVLDGPRLVSPRDMLRESLTRATKPREKRAGTTGNAELDAITGGFRPGFVWVFGAETSWGKSSWLVSVADENLKSGARVLIVSTEDAPSIYGDRLMARRARLNAKRLRDGNLNQDEIGRASNAVLKGERHPVYLEAVGRPVEWILEQLPRIVAEYGIDIIAVDYLQEIRSTKRHQDRRLELAYIAGELRACIKRLGKTGILFSQLTIGAGEKPDKYSIRDSKDVANGAEVIALGFTVPEGGMKAASGTSFDQGQRCILVEKNKDGAKGLVPVHWDDESACFRDKPNALYDEIDNLHDSFNDVFGDGDQ